MKKGFILFWPLLLLSVLGYNSLLAQTTSQPISSVVSKVDGTPSPFCPGELIKIVITGAPTNVTVLLNDAITLSATKSVDSFFVTLPHTGYPFNSPIELRVRKNPFSPATAVDSVNITINSLDTAGFSYSSPICQFASTVSPTTLGSNGNWTFSPFDGASMFTSSGNVNPSAGTIPRDVPISVTHITTGTCPDTVSKNITVVTRDTAWFTFNGAPYCRNGEPVMPSPGGGACPGCLSITSGGTWSSSPLGVSFDPASGEIDVKTSLVGTYDITYTTSGVCPHTDTDNGIQIRDTFSANFTYPASSICQFSSASDPDPIGMVSGTTSGDIWSAPGQVDINSGNGKIDVSDCTLGGPYTIQRIVPAFGTTCADTSYFNITIISQDTTQISYSSSFYCPNSPHQDVIYSPAPPSGTPNFTASNPAIVLNGATPGRIDTFATTPSGFYSIYFATTGSSCPAADTFDIQVLPLDNASFSYSSAQYCIALGNSPAAMKNVSADTGYFWGTGGVVVDSVTGIIDLIASDTGQYWIKYTTTGNCPNIDSFPIEVFRESALFHFDTTRFCELATGFFPQPTVDGTGGGRFYDPAGVLTPAVDSITGRINLGLVSSLGFHTIRYLSGGTCKDSMDVVIEIVQRDSATFDYLGNPFCYIDSIGVVTSRSDSSSGGRFMSFIPGDTALKIDSATGEIDLHNTPSGFYAVKYVSDSTCPDSSFMIIQVQQRHSIAINYLQDRYCKQDNDPVPAATGTGAGTGNYFCADPDIIVDPVTGRIDLGASLTGMYIVEYVTANPCSEIGFDTVYIDDQARVEWTFLNNIAEFCVSDPNPFPILDSLSDTTGTWYVGDTNRVKIDSTTGQIFLSQCIPNDSANTVYVLTYSVDLGAGTCPSEKSRTFTIAIPDSLSFFDYDTTGTGFSTSTTVCKSRSQRFAAIFGPDANRSGYFTGDSTLVFGDGFTVGGEVRSFTGEIDLNNTPPGTYLVTYNLAGTCITTPTHTITILPADSLSLATTASFYCKNLANPLLNTNGSNPPTGGNFIWSNNNPGSGDTLIFAATLVDVKIDLSNSDEGSYTISYISGPTASCPDTASVVVDLGDVPTPILVSDAPGNEICDNDTIVLDATNLNVFDHDFFWHLDSLNSPQLNSTITAEFQYVAVDPLDGSVYYSIAEDRDNGCRDTAQISIIVHPIPDGVIDRADTVISSDIPVSVDMLSDAPETYFHYCMVPLGNLLPDTAQCDSSGPWDAGQIAALEENFSVQGNFVPASVTIYITPIAFGCVGETDSVVIKLNPSDQDVFIPGLITPNGDSQNDYWRIQVRSGIPLDQYSLVLLNRSGGVAYEMFPLDENWTPNSLPDGVYWWVLKRADSGEMVRNGGVTIRRN